MKVSGTKIIFGATLLLVAPIAPAHGQEAVDVINTMGNPVQSYMTNWSDITNAIVNAITEASGQETSNVTSLSKMMTNSDDVKDAGQVKYGVDQARIQALEGATSGPGDCSALEAGVSMSGYEAMVSKYREQLADENLSFMRGDPQINGSPNPAAVSPEAAARKQAAAVCSGGFVSQSDYMLGLCGSKATAPQYPGLDTSGTDLFETLDYSPVQNSAAQLFLSHVVSPVPLTNPTASEIQSGSGPEIAANRAGLESRASLAGLFIAGAEARRQPLTNAPASLTDWANGEAGQLGGAFSETNGSYFPNGASMMDYGEVRADSYVYDAKYLAGISSQTTDPPLLKALVQVEGFRAWLEWQQFKLEEQRGLMDAALLANSQIPTASVGP